MGLVPLRLYCIILYMSKGCSYNVLVLGKYMWGGDDTELGHWTKCVQLIQGYEARYYPSFCKKKECACVGRGSVIISTIKIPSWLRAITTKARKTRKCPPPFLPIRPGKIIVDTCKDIFVPGMNWQVTGTTSILGPQKVHCIQMKSIFFEDIL